MFESSVGRKMWLQAVILPATLLEETRELCEKTSLQASDILL